MKTNHKLVLAVLAGVASWVAGAAMIRAQQVKAPPAYLIAELDVTDATTFEKYQESVEATVAAFNGHFVVRRGKIEALEGEAPKRFVVVAFDSAEKAHGWWDSPAYGAIKPIRLRSAKTRAFFVEGVAPQ
jgi:uncharacterized protein (DUF1330 family)